MAANYSFPILKNAEIVENLQEFKYNITEQEIKASQPEVVKNLFEHFVYIVMGVNRESVRQPEFEALGVFVYPELHDESMVEIVILRNM